MKFKVLAFAVLLTSLFIFSGCNCACHGSDKTATCPLPDKVASASCAVDLTVQ